jgi:protein-disulfide isomerase
MYYPSAWKLGLWTVGIIVSLSAILFGLLFYAQLRQLQGDPVITVTNTNGTNLTSDTITSLIPTSDQKSIGSTTSTTATNSTTTYTPTIDDDPIIGSNDAAVTIIAFEDFQCPYCAAAAPILRAVLQQYPNDVKLVFRDFPLYTIHAQALSAALAGECADDQNVFWQWHDLVYERQAQLSTAPDSYYDWATELGLDVDRFMACFTSEKHADEIDRDQNSGILSGVTATPTFFVNGYKVEGVISQDQWSNIIETLLAQP